MKKENMGKLNQFSSCFLCGSTVTVVTDYLRLNSDDFKRNLAYSLPKSITNFFCSISPRFATAYHRVAVNKKYFNRYGVYCRNCLTGSCQPSFEKEELANYYQKFYWNNRDFNDGQHVALADRPNNLQLALTHDRIVWIDQTLSHVESVIDFGAGDCAAAFTYSKRVEIRSVHVVDPSARTGALATKYGFGYSEDVVQAPISDLIYSAHSIEHVHDLLKTIRALLTKLRVGGHVFFETPNIGSQEIFEALCHTPHTFMLSASTFQLLEKHFPVKILRIECCGPVWQKNGKQIKAAEKADLRVLLKKMSDV